MQKLSVIITTHNRAELLKNAIKSVLAQTFSCFELLIIDDASTDSTESIVKSFIDDRIQYIKIRKEDSKGANYARNTGINSAKGEFIAFLDDDDEWVEEKLEKQLEVFKNNSDIGFVSTGYQYITAANVEQSIPLKRGDLSKEILVSNVVGPTSSIMVKKELLKKIGNFDEKMPACQDYDLYIRLFQICKVGFVAEPLLRYYVRINIERIGCNLSKYENAYALINEKYKDLISALEPNLKKQREINICYRLLAYAIDSCDKKKIRKYTLEYRSKELMFKPGLKKTIILFLAFIGIYDIVKLKRNIKNFFKFFVPVKLRGSLRNVYIRICINRKKRKMFPKISSLKPLKSQNSPQYIVSLTSYGKRLNETTPYTIATLFNQTIQPDKIVLWICEKDKKNICNKLKKLVKKGLEIRFCNDLRSYKKLIPSILEFPDDYIITADDDLYYPQDWFEQLITEHKKHPNKIICHRAHGMKVDNKNNPISYNDWDYCIESKYYLEKTKHSPFSIFPTGGAGTLYLPHSLYKDITNMDLFMKLAPFADDIWFWAMAVINKEYFKEECPYIVIENGYSKNLQDVEPGQQQNGNALWNYNGIQNGNDKQLQAVIEYYPQLKEIFKKIDTIKSNIPVSVIIPVYNAAQWLERTFNSIVKQIYGNDKIEAIFVDDCSTDNSFEILENLIKNYNGQIKFNLIKHSKEEHGFARNTGIKNAKGGYIYLMDADDEITENCLLLLVELAQKYENVDIVQGNTLRIESIKDGKPVTNPTWDISKNNFPEFVTDKFWIKERLGMWFRKNDYIPHSLCNKLIRKRFIIENNLYITKTQAGEDQLWNFYASKKIQSIAFANSYTYIYHREHVSVVSQTPDREKAVVPQIELCETILRNLDWEIASLQILLVKNLFECIKNDLDVNQYLYEKYSSKIEEIKGIINKGLSAILKQKNYLIK